MITFSFYCLGHLYKGSITVIVLDNGKFQEVPTGADRGVCVRLGFLFFPKLTISLSGFVDVTQRTVPHRTAPQGCFDFLPT